MHPSKILLFGEYSILLNSDALALPFKRFSGELINEGTGMNRKSETVKLSNQKLALLLSYFKENQIDTKLSRQFDFTSFAKDTATGMYFRSDIPEGCGLGSSGAVIASVYTKYTNQTVSEEDIPSIKKDLALIESFFHGRSSGIDPLVSYLKLPLLISEGNIRKMELLKIEKTLNEYGFFLVKSRDSVKTEGLVRMFETKCRTDSGYLKNLQNNYIPANNDCIKLFTENRKKTDFFSKIRELTMLQSELFREIIPERLKPLVKDGLKNDLFHIKLCGSGGGGYFIGFTTNTGETEKYFKDRDYRIIIP